MQRALTLETSFAGSGRGLGLSTGLAAFTTGRHCCRLVWVWVVLGRVAEKLKWCWSGKCLMRGRRYGTKVKLYKRGIQGRGCCALYAKGGGDAIVGAIRGS